MHKLNKNKSFVIWHVTELNSCPSHITWNHTAIYSPPVLMTSQVLFLFLRAQMHLELSLAFFITSPRPHVYEDIQREIDIDFFFQIVDIVGILFPLARLMHLFPGFYAESQPLCLKMTSIVWCYLYIRAPCRFRWKLLFTCRPLAFLVLFYPILLPSPRLPRNISFFNLS